MPARPRGVVVVFAKAPRAGHVKTRLSPGLSAEAAAAFYDCMLRDVVASTSRTCVAAGLDLVLALHPFEARAEIARWAPQTLRIVAQRGRDLSERMGWAVAEAAASGFSRILLRGSDSPLLPERALRRALSSLDTHDLAISPDRDGGYSLISLRRPCAGLFDHPMSTNSVLEQTLANAAGSRLRVQEIEAGSDIDTIEDLGALLALRDDADARSLAPRCFEFAERNSLWHFASAEARDARS